tara:strand:+ start:61 stop:432 length:372 start_codon:yes stop_codon:yes gene_type:complete
VTDAELIAFHPEAPSNATNWVKIGRIGVDSAQAGFFDKPVFRNDGLMPAGFELKTFDGKHAIDDELWCFYCCELTKKGAAVVPGAVVGHSGYGDGGYPLYGITNSAGLYVALRLIFVDDDGFG